jgi:hypothetical protein
MTPWRNRYQLHPFAAEFPMMSDEDLRALGKDIKANGLKSPIVFLDPGSSPDTRMILVDGRNRLEAMQRAGINWLDVVAKNHKTIWQEDDAVPYIISANIHRRHLSKQERADIIVAIAKARIEKPGQVGPVSPDGSAKPPKPAASTRPAVVPKGGRGVQNAVKQTALSINRKLPEDQQVSERTIKRSIAKAEGRLPEPSRFAGPKLSSRPKLEKHVGIEAARNYYLERCAQPDIDLDHEREMVLEAFRELAGKRAMAARATARAPQ